MMHGCRIVSMLDVMAMELPGKEAAQEFPNLGRVEEDRITANLSHYYFQATVTIFSPYLPSFRWNR
jgi:hypothetical protein